MLKSATKVVLALTLAVTFAATRAHAQSRQKLKVAEVVRSQLFAPMYVALGQGFMKEQGIDVELVTDIGGDRVGALMRSGRADIGLAGPEVAIYIIGWRPGSTPQLFFEYILKQKGVDPETIRSIITNIAPPAREGAWTSGNGDFGIFNEPSTSNLVRTNQVHVVASIGKELGPVENSVFFAMKGWFEKNRNWLRN